MHPDIYFDIARIVTGLVGTFFLFNEVRIAHKVEGLKTDVEELRKGQGKIEEQLNSSTNKSVQKIGHLLENLNNENVESKREILTQFLFLGSGDEDAIRQMYASMSEKEINELFDKNLPIIKITSESINAQNIWLGNIQNQVKLHMPELERLTSDNKMRFRKFYLYMGFGFIVISFFIDLYIQYEKIDHKTALVKSPFKVTKTLF